MNVLLVGLGRIGKLVARSLLTMDKSRLNWVGAVERERNLELYSYLLNHDSTYGTLNPKVGHTGNSFEVPGYGLVALFDDIAESIEKIAPDLVIDCSGSHQSAEILTTTGHSTSRRHLFAQAVEILKQTTDSKVWVVGVNDNDFQNVTPQNIINPGCLNNCLIPLISSLNTRYKIIKGTFVSVHSVTNTQPSLDKATRSPRLSRASGANLVPAAHDSMTMINKFFPDLREKLVGRTVRAPVSHTSYVTCTFELTDRTDAASVLNCLGSVRIAPTVFGVDQEPLVSSDYLFDSRSCVVDGTSLRVIGGTTLFISAWYNNEYAFACRMIDIASQISQPN